MNLVTVGGLTLARSANRATLSRPAIGYEASRTRASFRSAGLRESSRSLTASPTPLPGTDITFHRAWRLNGTFLTTHPRSLVILSHNHEQRKPASDRHNHQRASRHRVLRPIPASRRGCGRGACEPSRG